MKRRNKTVEDRKRKEKKRKQIEKKQIFCENSLGDNLTDAVTF